MGRLIDADVLKNIIASEKNDNDEMCRMCIESTKEIIDEQPTAYDLDKVVQQLEKRIQTHERCIEYEKKNGTITEEFQQRKAVEVLEGAIEIVKGGGANA